MIFAKTANFKRNSEDLEGTKLLQNYEQWSSAHYSPSNCMSGQRTTEGGGTQERGKHTIKPLPKNGFGPPLPPMIRSPPPLCSRPVIFHREETGTDQTNPIECPLQKLVLEGALYSAFPPPQNRTMRFLNPPPHPVRVPNQRSEYPRSTFSTAGSFGLARAQCMPRDKEASCQTMEHS